MRNLKWYLLQEAKEPEEKKKSLPYEQFSQIIIQGRGRITNELKDLLGIDGAKELNLNKNMKAKANTAEGKAEILKDLGNPPAEFVNLYKAVFSGGSPLASLFSGEARELDVDGSECVVMDMVGGWQAIAKKQSSSEKFIRFWIQSIGLAAGLPIGNIQIGQNSDRLYVLNKK